jgi:hypothetical protein
VKLLKNTILREKISESIASVLPVSVIVLLLLVTFFPVSAEMLLSFVIGAVLIILGMSFFTLGADTAMTPMGEYVGARMTATRKVSVIVIVSFIVGVMITISEPDLTVLANQLTSIDNYALILSVALGVGVMLVIALLRILFRVRLKYLLIAFYLIVFVLAFFIPKNFLAVSFDSGGVTTGPMTVPFIMALGVGVASIRSDDGSNDSFGLVALCSVGPILAVMILGLITGGGEAEPPSYDIPALQNSRDIILTFIEALPHYMMEVAIAVGPIVVFFLIFRAISGGARAGGLGKIFVGVVYTYLGLVIFLTGVNVGFMPIGNYLGQAIADTDLKWIIVPLGMLIGYFIVAAEPAVHVLTRQVERETEGAIPGRMLSLALSFGVALSVGIAMLRVLLQIPILYILVPGYAIALILTFFVPDIFTSIAFDSGGVASGPMTATFLLPFAVGACTAVGGNIVEDAFGVVAMVAMTPLIAIQILGLVFRIKQSRAKAIAAEEGVIEEPIVTDNTSTPVSDDDIIEF